MYLCKVTIRVKAESETDFKLRTVATVSSNPCLHHSHIENNNLVTLTNTNMFNPSPFASAANREIYHTVLAQRLKVETARKASERKKIDDAIEKILECPE